MKKAAALLVLSCAFLAQPHRAAAEPIGAMRLCAPLPDQAQAQLRGGRILTIMGIVHLAVGGALLAEMAITSSQCMHTRGCREEMGGIPEVVAGSLLVSSGAVFIASGLPSWVIGAGAAGRETITIQPSAGGLRLTY